MAALEESTDPTAVEAETPRRAKAARIAADAESAAAAAAASQAEDASALVEERIIERDRAVEQARSDNEAMVHRSVERDDASARIRTLDGGHNGTLTTRSGRPTRGESGALELTRISDTS